MTIAAGATLAGLGVLVGLAVGSGGSATKLAAQQAQPVEVRTEVIRKTVNVYRRAKPHHVAAGASGGGAAGVARSTAVARTRTSPARSSLGSTGSAPVTTRASGGAATGAPSTPRSEGGVRTRTSGAGSSSPAVRTRSSGGGERDGGGHDD